MDGFEVLSDVFAPVAVTPGGAHLEAPSGVDQLHRHPVHLGLDHVIEAMGGAQKALEAVLEVPGLGLGKSVFQGEHGDAVGHRLEFIQGGGPHALSGRVRGNECGVVGFKAGEFAQEPVKLGIGDYRVIEDIVTVVVVVDLIPSSLTRARTSGGASCWLGIPGTLFP